MSWLASGGYRKSVRFMKMAALYQKMELLLCRPRSLCATLAEPSGTDGARSVGLVLGFKAGGLELRRVQGLGLRVQVLKG